MTPEPRHQDDYSARQIEAARRVLIDVGQILGSYRDCMVVVGGWVPDLLITEAEEPHIGSIDVDLALDAEKLNDGRYAELLKLLTDTRRYRNGTREFQFLADVDLKDGGKLVQVEVEFLAPKDVKLRKNKPKLLAGFRVLQVDGCENAFRDPVMLKLPGRNVRGVNNTVQIRVASVADFLVMKAYAMVGRDKPKDAYDICYCLEQFPGGMEKLATDWKSRAKDGYVMKAIAILKEKFASVNSFGPGQIIEFHNSDSEEEKKRQARRAFEVVQALLKLL